MNTLSIAPATRASRDWHLDLLRAVPWFRSWRGCLGIGIRLDRATDRQRELGRHIFVPNNNLEWHLVCDVPPGRCLRRARPLIWATAQQADCWQAVPMFRPCAGMPACDLSAGGAGQGDRHAIWEAVSLAMTSTAVETRRPWNNYRQTFLEALGLDTTGPAFWFGNRRQPSWPRPDDWMPRPFIAVPEKLRGQMVEMVVDAGSRLGDTALHRRFLAAVGRRLPIRAPVTGTLAGIESESSVDARHLRLDIRGDDGQCLSIHATAQARLFRDILPGAGARVEAGQLLGLDGPRPPAGWFQRPLAERGEWARRMFRRPILESALRCWFQRQSLTLEAGLVHFPADLLVHTAKEWVAEGNMLWEISRLEPYLNADLDAFIAPPISLRSWDAFRGTLPGAVYYDLSPQHPAYDVSSGFK